MNNQPISKNEYVAAQYTIERINPVISALEQLNKQVIGNEDQFLEVVGVHNLLKGIRDEKLAVLDAGNSQYESRDTDLINAAAVRLNRIPRDIELEEKTFEHRVKARQFKADELLSLNFSITEIDAVIPPISQDDIDASRAVVAGLQKEAKALMAFLNDAPAYNIELLKQTSINTKIDVAA
jgi:hypothetical protein